jgi:MoxR-like ATPase
MVMVAEPAILRGVSRSGVITILPGSISDLQQRLADQHYVADRGLAVSVFLALRLKRPLFLEGEAGVGKTSMAGAVAAALGTDLIRLQWYEGLDVGHALTLGLRAPASSCASSTHAHAQ